MFWFLLQYHSSNLWSLWTGLHYMFICVTFKSHTQWSKTQCVSVSITMILPTSGYLLQLELVWSHDICTANEHVSKYLTHPWCKLIDFQCIRISFEMNMESNLLSSLITKGSSGFQKFFLVILRERVWEYNEAFVIAFRDDV